MDFEYDGTDENNVEFLKDQDRATAYFTKQKFVNRMRKLKELHPDEVDIAKDGGNYILAHFPAKWVHINPPRKITLTDEQRQALAERLKEARISHLSQ